MHKMAAKEAEDKSGRWQGENRYGAVQAGIY